MNFKDVIDLYIQKQEFKYINGKLYNAKGKVIFENTKPSRDYTVYTKKHSNTTL